MLNWPAIVIANAAQKAGVVSCCVAPSSWYSINISLYSINTLKTPDIVFFKQLRAKERKAETFQWVNKTQHDTKEFASFQLSYREHVTK